MNVRSPTFVTVAVPPRNDVVNAPGAFVAHTCATFSFQNGLFVCDTIANAFVLPVIVYVSARPFVTVAVIGMISDFPAGTVTGPMGLMTGAAPRPKAVVKKSRTQAQRANISRFKMVGDYFSIPSIFSFFRKRPLSAHIVYR